MVHILKRVIPDLRRFVAKAVISISSKGWKSPSAHKSAVRLQGSSLQNNDKDNVPEKLADDNSKAEVTAQRTVG